MRRAPRRLPRCVAIGALTVALLATGLPRTGADPAAAAPSPNGRPVRVYGDSVLLGAKPALESRLTADGWRPTVSAWVGANMPAVIQLVRSQRSQIGDVVVLGVGNNYFGNPTVFRQEVDELMGVLRGVRRVVWLNLREYRPDRRDANRVLSEATSRWTNLEIADWNSFSLTRSDTFWNDGLHLRPEGARLMAELVARRLQAYLAGAPPARGPTSAAPAGPVRPRVYAYGGARALPGADAVVSSRPFVGSASTTTGRGYWLVASDGGIFTFGDARFRGSTGNLRLNQPVVGMAATPTGRGYWLVASDGGIFTFGDARFRGSTGNLRLNQPVVGMAATPTGRGYWLVASDGGIFSFGDARFRGSTGNLRLNQPVVGMAATPTGRGYWLVAYDGGVFSFGGARFHGSRGGERLYWPVVGIAAHASGAGYWIVAADGRVDGYGRAPMAGHRGGRDRADGFFAVTARPGGGYWIAAQRAA